MFFAIKFGRFNNHSTRRRRWCTPGLLSHVKAIWKGSSVSLKDSELIWVDLQQLVSVLITAFEAVHAGKLSQ
ncbi:hypothetical protein R1flu_023189 [Riccia fluitans]|uniref:Transposase n=1 Tax=Riccia fluitans TaxID=41844 RepID=A0ABD1XRB3_9MARC